MMPPKKGRRRPPAAAPDELIVSVYGDGNSTARRRYKEPMAETVQRALRAKYKTACFVFGLAQDKAGNWSGQFVRKGCLRPEKVRLLLVGPWASQGNPPRA